MNQKEEKQLKNAYRALNKIFKLNDKTDNYEDNILKLNLYDYCSDVKQYRYCLKKYLHIIEAELDDVLGIYPKHVKMLNIFKKSQIT